MNQSLRAVLHVHSTYSDGEFTLAELRDVFERAGCRAICLADHAEYFDEDQLAQYCAECEQLSDHNFVFVPGLEFRCDRRMHIVGYGVRALTAATEPSAVIQHIDASGGVSVVAHPADTHLSWIPQFARLPRGIEAWNTKYDGRYAPRPAVFALIESLRRHPGNVLAFYGLDLHWRHQYRGLHCLLEVAEPWPAGVLAALREGRFRADKDGLLLPSSSEVPPELLRRFAAVNGRSRRFRKAVALVKEWTGPLVSLMPARVKGQLRRFF